MRAVERVDENLDLDSMFDMDEGEKAMVYQTYTETMHLCYNFGFEVIAIILYKIVEVYHRLETRP